MCYDLESLRDTYSAQIALMYDQDNLYVGIHWKDPIPMGNSHDPRYQANKGWAGDCVQLRLKTDCISHVTAWYYAAGKEPAIQIEYGKSLNEPFGGGSKVLLRTDGWKLTEGAEMAFRKDADGKGYVQEIKLPWKLITEAKIPVAGERIACGVDLLWGEVDWPVHRYSDNLAEGASSREFFFTAYKNWGPAFLEPKGNLKLPVPPYLQAARRQDQTEGPVEITYTLPKDTHVTLAIEDGAGRRIRNLIAARLRQKGKNIEHWDGLDDAGRIMPPGKYRFKAIYHDGIHVRYVLSYANPGHPTWPTPDNRGQFYGDHSAPHAVATAGGYVGLACPIGESGQPLIGCDLTGQRLWGLANRVFAGDQITSLATDGKTLWVASDGQKCVVYRVDITTGQYSPWKMMAKNEQGQEYRVLDLEIAVPALATGSPAPANLTAISYHEGTLAACLRQNNEICLLDAETGVVKTRLSVPKPQSAVIDADGSLIVLSQGRLLRLGRDGTSAPFTDGLYPDGYALAIDTTRRIYLSVRGADQNVKVLTPDGKLLQEIGKRAGRPLNGPYDANAMRNPAQIAVDNQGNLWVTEETTNPKRTSVWNTMTGALVKDLAGTTSYAGAGALDPADLTVAFSDNTVYTLDWQKGTYRPVYSVAKRDDPADIFPPNVMDITNRVIHRGNYTYVFTPHDHCTLWDGKVWRSAAHFGMVNRNNDPWNAPYKNPIFDGHEGQLCAWADKNGDGLVQADELTFAPLPTRDGKPLPFQSYYWGMLPGPDGTLIYINRDRYALIKFAITGYSECGAPVYDITHPQVVPVNEESFGQGNGEGMIIGGNDGRVYLNQDPILSVDNMGHVLGSYPSHFTSVHGSHDARAARPGYIIGPSSFLGVADLGGDIGEVFYLNGNLGENYLFTQDGLWIQSLFKDVRGGYETPTEGVRGMPMDATTAGGESFGGNFVRTNDGHVYLTLGGTDARIMEVTGLESIRRLSGNFIYLPKQYAEAEQLARVKAIQNREAKEYKIARATSAVTIDGAPTDWPELLDDQQTTIEIQENPERRYGRVAMRYNQQYLYLAYRVFDAPNGLRNAGQDERLLFKTGDAVDLMLSRADSGSDSRGGLRLLMTMVHDQPHAILYQKQVPGTPQAARVPFSSPWRTIYFDRVIPASTVQWTSRPLNGGYFVEAAIPWRLLGIAQPRPGMVLRGDVGILYADSGGTTTVSRQYWCNKATGLVNDVPGEADLTPELWGTFLLQ